MRGASRITDNSSKDRIRHEGVRKQLGRNATKRQQLKWFGHVIR
jgi:hypothetical protein